MRPARRLPLVVIALLAIIGCTAVLPTETSEERLTAAVSRSTAGSPDALKPALEAEKARIAREGERSKAAYDSLKVVWDHYHQNRGRGNIDPHLLICDPLQYAADTKIIGPEGGDMSIGPHKLSIPSGALSKYVVVTGEMPVSLLVSVKMSPHGLQFRKTPRLTLSYKHCDNMVRFQKRIAYVDDLGRIVEWPLSKDSAGGAAEALIWHFSRYAVAW